MPFQGKVNVFENYRIIDLSHAMIPGREEYGLELVTRNTADIYPQYPVSTDTWYILQSVSMGSHCGTHIEFPYHHNRKGLDAGSFPLTRLISECSVLNFRHKSKDEAVTLDELFAVENRIRTRDAVLFNFGVSQDYGTERGHDRPYISEEAVRWLADEKKINIIGSDASGIEVKGKKGQPNHQYLMERQIPIIEFVANLDSVNRERVMLFVLALPIKGLDSCPVRLIAFEEKE